MDLVVILLDKNLNGPVARAIAPVAICNGTMMGCLVVVVWHVVCSTLLFVKEDRSLSECFLMSDSVTAQLLSQQSGFF